MKRGFFVVVLVLAAIICLLPGGSIAQTLTFEIASAGSTTSDTRLAIEGDTSGTTYSIQSIFSQSGGLVKDGDTVILPEGDIYYSPIVDIYNDVTVKGKGENKTVLHVLDGSQKSRGFRIQGRSAADIKNKNITYVTFENLTIDGKLGAHEKESAFVLTSYNIDLTLNHVTVQGFGGAVFGAWANDLLDDDTYPTREDNVGISIHLDNVTTKDNANVLRIDTTPTQNDVKNGTDKYGFVNIDYTKSCQFDDKGGAGIYTYSQSGYSDLTYDYNTHTNPAGEQNNARINDMYVSYGDMIPVNPVVNTVSMPQTGDESHLALYLALLAMSAAVLGVMRRTRRA